MNYFGTNYKTTKIANRLGGIVSCIIDFSWAC